MPRVKLPETVPEIWREAVDTQWSSGYVNRRLYVFTMVSDGSMQIENQDVTLGFAGTLNDAQRIVSEHERRKPYLDRNEICAMLDWEGFVEFPILWGTESESGPIERTVLCCWDTSDAIWQIDWRGAVCLTPDDFYDWLDRSTDLYGDYCDLT